MKLSILIILFSTLLFSQPFISKEENFDEAKKRKLSQIKTGTKYEYGFTFGERNKAGDKLEETEYTTAGYESTIKWFKGNLVNGYSLYEYDENNNPVIYSEFDEYNRLVLKDENEFNDAGLHTSKLQYGSDMQIFIKVSFEYNSKNQHIGGSTIYSNGALYSKWTYKYEGQNIKENIIYDSEGKVSSKTIFEYSKNKIIKSIEYKSDGAKFEEINFEYPSKYKTVEIKSIYFFADPVITKTIVIKDNDDNILETYLEKDDGSINWRIKYAYDKNGNPLEEIHYNALDEPEKAIVYSYSFY